MKAAQDSLTTLDMKLKERDMEREIDDLILLCRDRDLLVDRVQFLAKYLGCQDVRIYFPSPSPATSLYTDVSTDEGSVTLTVSEGVTIESFKRYLS